MELTAAEIMHTDPVTVEPALDLPALERLFIARQVSGFPVVEDGRLVGVVARSDVVRQICVERTNAEQLSDYYLEYSVFHAAPAQSLAAIADQVGQRIDSLRVADVMATDIVSVDAQAPIAGIARVMVARHIHRVPVTEAQRLVGIITSLDLVRLIAERRIGSLSA